MQDELISRQAVRHILNHEIKMPIKVWKKLFELVDDLPPITPQPKTGHWIEEIDDYGKVICWHCDKCYEDSGFTTDCKWDFCPKCGARMVAPQESEEISDRNMKMWEEIFKAESEGLNADSN